MAQTESRVRLVFEGSERGVVAAAAKSSAALKALGDENTTVGKKFAAADQQATKFIGTLTKTAAVTSLVAAGGGLLGQAFAGALPILTSLGVGALTVKLGMDGIKKAAEGAKKPFGDLQKAVSGTFEKDLKGPVKDVAGLLPKLTSGFQGVAASISGAAGQITGFAASARGVAVLRDVLAGTAQFIDGLGPQLATFLDGFLSAIASARTEMRGLGDAFGSIFGDMGTVLRTLANDDAGTFAKAVAGLSATLRGLSDVLSTVIGTAIQLGAAFGDSFGVLLTGLADGIKKASPGLVDLGTALGDLFRAIAPLLPTIGELAGQFAHALADGIRAVIPYVKDFADWARNNVDTVKGIAEAIGALALGVKALNIFTSVVGWVDGAIGILGRFSAAAEGSRLKALGLQVGIAALKVVGVGAALAAIGLAAEEMGGKADAAGLRVTGLKDSLATFGKAAREFNLGFFLDQFIDEIKFGEVVWRQFQNLINGFKFTPINFEVNTAPGRTQVRTFLNEVNSSSPQVNINGNTNAAGFALREILDEISQGKAEVVIDGRPVPAQEALQHVLQLINDSNPSVQINGESKPAGDALAEFLKRAQGSTATATLGADPQLAYETVGGWTRAAEGTVGLARLNADPAQANGVRDAWKTVTAATTGVAHLNAEPGGANAVVAGWKGSANATTGLAHLNAERGQANATTSGWSGDAGRTTATAHLHAEDSVARSVLSGLYNTWAGKILTWTVNLVHGLGFAQGGPVFTGKASGGAIRGPGTGTSDTAGLFRLSNGEHVLTAREVAAAGGHAAIFALRRSLLSGGVPRMAATSGRAATGGGITSAGALTIPAPIVNVAVHVDGNEVRSLVRTEIQSSSRATRRTVLAGAGTTF